MSYLQKSLKTLLLCTLSLSTTAQITYAKSENSLTKVEKNIAKSDKADPYSDGYYATQIDKTNPYSDGYYYTTIQKNPDGTQNITFGPNIPLTSSYDIIQARENPVKITHIEDTDKKINERLRQEFSEKMDHDLSESEEIHFTKEVSHAIEKKKKDENLTFSPYYNNETYLITITNTTENMSGSIQKIKDRVKFQSANQSYYLGDIKNTYPNQSYSLGNMKNTYLNQETINKNTHIMSESYVDKIQNQDKMNVNTIKSGSIILFEIDNNQEGSPIINLVGYFRSQKMNYFTTQEGSIDLPDIKEHLIRESINLSEHKPQKTCIDNSDGKTRECLTIEIHQQKNPDHLTIKTP